MPDQSIVVFTCIMCDRLTTLAWHHSRSGTSSIESNYEFIVCIVLLPPPFTIALHGLTSKCLAQVFMLVNTGETLYAALAQVWMAFILAGIGAPLPAWFITTFPPKTRYSGVGIGYRFLHSQRRGSKIERTAWLASHCDIYRGCNGKLFMG